MLYKNPEELTPEEREVLVLKAALFSINSMANYNMFDFHFHENESSVQPKTDVHHKLFGVLLVDFLSLETFTERTPDILEQLQSIATTPSLSTACMSLLESSTLFSKWLDEHARFKHNNEIIAIGLSAINSDISLNITRRQFIKICGNVSKHNQYGLDRQAREIKKIFLNSGHEIEHTDAMLIIDEFYEQFHGYIITYHTSTIVEFLNNIRWAIHEYLQPLYASSTEHYYDSNLKNHAYRYNYPNTIKNKYIKHVFWELMNDVRNKPYVQKFVTSQWLKLRY